MSFEAPASAAPTTLAPGWEEEDVAMLREVAQLAMEMTRELVAEVREQRKAKPDPAATAHAELRFARITRTLRLSLSLKAKARGAGLPPAVAAPVDPDAFPLDPLSALGAPFNPVFSATPLEEDGYPGVDPAERITYHAGEVRRELSHVFDAPDREAAEVERLWTVAENHIDRARAFPTRFVIDKPSEIVDAICKEVGLPIRRHELRDHRGWNAGSYIARPDEPDSPPVLTTLPPVTDFMLSRPRWRKAKPP